jgi:hypothetical protein
MYSNVCKDVQQGDLPMSEPKVILKANWDRIVAQLHNLIENCTTERAKAQDHLTECQQQIDRCNIMVERLNGALEVAMHGSFHPPIIPSDEPGRIQPLTSTPETASEKIDVTPHKDVIADVMQRHGHLMSTSAITRQVYKEGTIKSKNGYRGVYSTVTTTLKRYNKHLFVRVRRGVWDLRERRQARMQQTGLHADVVAIDKKGDIIAVAEVKSGSHLN